MLLVLSGAAVLLTVVVIGADQLLARRNAWRWGHRPTEAVEVGAGPFRRDEVRGEEPRGVPASVRTAAHVGFVWAVPTLLLFAPAGGVLGLMTLTNPESALFGFLLLVAVLSGLSLGPVLVVSGISLLTASREGSWMASATAVWTIVHHVGVGVVFTLGAVTAALFSGEEEMAIAALLVWLPATFGIAHGLVLYRAAREKPVVPS